jgi:hypothetical protein
VRFLTSYIAAVSLAVFLGGCGARSALDEGAFDAGLQDVVSCTGPAPTPVLVAHLAVEPAGSQVTQTDDELITALDGNAYRVVAISKCTGAIRDIVAPREGGVGGLALAGDTIFVSDEHDVYSVPISGGSTHSLATIDSAGELAVDDTDVYLSGKQRLTRIPRFGGSPTVIANHGGDIAIDDTFIFLFSNDAGLLRISKSDPSQVTTMDAPPGYQYQSWWAVGRLALSPTAVFFTQITAQTTTVCGVPKLGGNPVCSSPLAGGSAASPIVWNASVYFQTLNQIVRMDSTTGATSTLVTAKLAPIALWVDETSVFWITFDFDLYRIDK